MSKEILVLREREIRAALDMQGLVDAMERAFVAYSGGQASLPDVIHLDVPEGDGEIHVKAGHLHGAPTYAVKVASGFYASDPPAVDGLVLAFDARDGSPRAILFDNGAITDARTGAAGGVAARHLAPRDVGVVAVLGSGQQARRQVEALACERNFGEVRVWGRTPEHVAACVEDLRSLPGLPDGCRVSTAGSVRAALEGAEVVLTCTASREPLVRADWLAPGAHVTAVGSDGAGKQELDPDVLGRADLVVADSRSQCARLGELAAALGVGAVAAPEEVAELGEIASGRRPGRTSREQLTVCDLTGVGVQDVAAALLVLDRCGEAGERLAL